LLDVAFVSVALCYVCTWWPKIKSVKRMPICPAGPILSVFPALIVHSELKCVHPGFPVAFIFKHKLMNTFIHQNGRLTDRDNIYNRLKTYYE